MSGVHASSTNLTVVSINSSTSGRNNLPVPPGILAYVPINVTNSQDVPTPAPFQQIINADSLTYSAFEAPNLQNVEFFTSQGVAIPSWLESGADSNSTVTIYWLKLASAIPAKASAVIYMGFASRNSNLFEVGISGEAPSISTTYGQYDNGGRVFTYYTNFSGTSLPSSLQFTEQSNNECGVQTNATYHVDNDLIVNATGSLGGGCGGGAFFDTLAKYSPSVVEADLVSQTGPSSVSLESFYPVVAWDTILPSTFWGGDGGYAFDYRVCGCGTQWQIMEGNTGALAGWVVTASSSAGVPSGVYGIGWSKSGNQYGWQQYREQLTSTNETYSYQPAHGGFGYVNSEPTPYNAVFDWFRIRALPPNGEMPSVSFGAVVVPNPSTEFSATRSAAG